MADTLAATYMDRTAHAAGAAAEALAAAKVRKYDALADKYIIVPLAFETLGPICAEGVSFVRDLGKRLTEVSRDLRETAYLFQRLSIAIQRGNALSVLATLNSGTKDLY